MDCIPRERSLDHTYEVTSFITPLLKTDEFVKSPTTCHCEERSDEAMTRNQALTKYEIASLRPEHHAVQGFPRNDHLGDFL
jgi:hypothetical protein